jgi:hypothetical protein
LKPCIIKHCLAKVQCESSYAYDYDQANGEYDKCDALLAVAQRILRFHDSVSSEFKPELNDLGDLYIHHCLLDNFLLRLK